MSRVNLVSARTLDEAVMFLAEHPSAKILAGGTDLVVQMREGQVVAETLVDISRVEALGGIIEQGSVLRIGSITTFAELARNPLVDRYASALAMAAQQVGSEQIRNQGTIGGNIANASPAGDILPPLFVLEARVEVSSVRGRRQLPIAECLAGVGKNTFRPDELITGISFPLPKAGTRSAFVKLGRRKAMAIARISMALLVFVNEDGIIEEARLALGAVGTTVFRATRAEQVLCHRPVGRDAVEDCLKVLSEIVAEKLGSRASAVYKRQAIRGVAEEAFFHLFPELNA